MDTLERYFSHSVTRSRIVPLSLLLWTSFKSSEFIKFSAINYHSVYIQIFALSLSRIVAGFCSRNVLSQQHDLGRSDLRGLCFSLRIWSRANVRLRDTTTLRILPPVSWPRSTNLPRTFLSLSADIFYYLFFFYFFFLSDTACNIHNIISTHVSVVHYSCGN